MPTERRLAAIMFTDIVGSTAATARSESVGLALRDRHREVVRSQVHRYHGRLIEATGDESLSTFDSAVDAVHAALAIQHQLEGDAELQVRIGIHLGETMFRGDEVFGDGVNIASRVRPLAEPGGVCISDEVQHAIRNQGNVETVLLGEHELKNVGRPISVYVVSGRPGKPPGPGARPSGRPSSDMVRSLAVLPLENLSGDPEQEYFADGMTEAVITELARTSSLPVISRTSVMQYKRARKPLPEIAQELGVDMVIEGTVMRAGDHVRITVQLIEAHSDRHVWGDNYDRELSDVLALLSEVARAVAAHVRREFAPGEQAALAASRPVEPRAYDAYLRGLQLRGTPSFVMDWGPPAIEQFERAVELDPGFAEGYAALAEVREKLGVVGFALRHRGELPKARAAAQRALELDDRLGGAHATLGSVKLFYDWDFGGARRAYERALRLSPSDPALLDRYAYYLEAVEGSTEDALEVRERLLHVAPLDEYFRAVRVSFFLSARRYERALEEIERMRELVPNWVDANVYMVYRMLGRLDDSYRALLAFFERIGPRGDKLRDAAKRGWAEGGWEGSMRALALAQALARGASPAIIAFFYAWIGETDEAFAWLERGYRDRDPQIIQLKSYVGVDSLRSDPRYDDLLRRIGFPES